MKKSILKVLFVVVLVLGLGFAFQTKNVNAEVWGAKKAYVTPKSARGVWYYKDGKKIRRLHITRSSVNGLKLYQVLPDKQYEKLLDKLMNLPVKKMRRTYNYFDKHMVQAYSMKWRKLNAFNYNGWLSGAGDGMYVVPVKRAKNGQKVSALRLGTGAGNYFYAYAYKTRKLAR